ncbi:MAG: ATP-binding domain-containing protein, partial [Lachnospiraceae bacterium]|nr:ATP-binding domain-containing protein [Lachnospiraceae bacterium]
KVDFIMQFADMHEGTKDIIMDTNYRSSPEIIGASNILISKNRKRIDKSLKAVKSTNGPVVYQHAKTTAEEAMWIAENVLDIVTDGNKYDDITILYRAHYVSRSVEEAFLRKGIPYTIYSGIEFYRRKEIKDILCYLRMLVNKDDLSFIRVINVPSRNIGKKKIAFLEDYAKAKECSMYEALKDNLLNPLFKKTEASAFVAMIEKYSSVYMNYKLVDIINEILIESGYENLLRLGGEEERLANMAEFKQSIFEYEKTSGEYTNLDDYLQNISLLTNVDREQKKDSVKLMTIHNAKGLEFPYVFVCGLNEGIFPGKHTDTLDKLEEERRLAYVAFTRAEKKLFLTESEGITFDGLFRYPSRFIFNTEKEFVEYVSEIEESIVESANKYIDLNESKIYALVDNEFKVGDRIIHKVFGKGTILDICPQTTSFVIKFDCLDTNRSINMRVKLEKDEG